MFTEAAPRFAQTFWHADVDSMVTVDDCCGPQARDHLCWPAINSTGCLFHSEP